MKRLAENRSFETAIARSVSRSEISTARAVFSRMDRCRIYEDALIWTIVKAPSGELPIGDIFESAIGQHHSRIGEELAGIGLNEIRCRCRKTFRNIGIVK